MTIINDLFRFVRILNRIIYCFFTTIIVRFIFKLYNVKHDNLHSNGLPYIHISKNAQFELGSSFLMNNGVRYSDSGINGKCKIEVRDKAILTIGNNVGISDVTIICHENITICDNVLIGVGSQIRDTDNHSINPIDWLNGCDWENKKTKAVLIESNVFIGTNVIVLKGVKICQNSIVGAGSVVTKSIPRNELWAGNPAKFIKNIEYEISK